MIVSGQIARSHDVSFGVTKLVAIFCLLVFFNCLNRIILRTEDHRFHNAIYTNNFIKTQDKQHVKQYLEIQRNFNERVNLQY